MRASFVSQTIILRITPFWNYRWNEFSANKNVAVFFEKNSIEVAIKKTGTKHSRKTNEWQKRTCFSSSIQIIKVKCVAICW